MSDTGKLPKGAEAAEGKERLLVHWQTADPGIVGRIRRRFGIPAYTTINGFSPVEVAVADMPDLLLTERLGYVRLLRVKWRSNGATITF